MTIKRYDSQKFTAGMWIIGEKDGGRFVRYDDYAALEEKYHALIKERDAQQGKPIAWESITPVYVKFITDDRYQRFTPGVKKWYRPYLCARCSGENDGIKGAE